MTATFTSMTDSSAYCNKLSVNLVFKEYLKKNACLPEGFNGNVWMKQRKAGLQKNQVII